MKKDNPLKVILKDLLPVRMIVDLKERIHDQDWDGFFTSLTGVGLASLIVSLGLVLFTASLSRLFGDRVELVGLLIKLITNFTAGVVILYMLGLGLLYGVRSTVENEPLSPKTLERTNSIFESVRGTQMFKFGVYVVNALLLTLFLGLLLLFRSILIIPVNSVTIPTNIIEILLVFLVAGLDLGYLGIVLLSFGQLYETGKALMQL